MAFALSAAACVWATNKRNVKFSRVYGTVFGSNASVSVTSSEYFVDKAKARKMDVCTKAQSLHMIRNTCWLNYGLQTLFRTSTFRYFQWVLRLVANQTLWNNFLFLNRDVDQSSMSFVNEWHHHPTVSRSQLTSTPLYRSRYMESVGWQCAITNQWLVKCAKDDNERKRDNSTDSTTLTCLWAACVLGHLLQRQRRRLPAEKRLLNHRRRSTIRQPFASTPPTWGSCIQSEWTTAAGGPTIPLIREMEWSYPMPTAVR